MTDISLEGCLSDPLMMNLKALGIFRIIAEQKDKSVKANWEQGTFIIHTQLSKDELANFFLNEYKPTPIVSPWNRDSGFFDLDEDSIVYELKQKKDERLKEYHDVFNKVEEIFKECIPEYVEMMSKKDKNNINKLKKRVQDKKDLLLREFRNRINVNLIPWLDAMYIIASEKPSYGTILGTGGNDGNFEISKNFMSYICKCILSDRDNKKNKEWINGSLFNTSTKLLVGSAAYFYPDGYKGPNCVDDPSKEKTSLINPWDFILMVEGTLFFAGNISRRSISTNAAFPFSVNQSNAGYGSSSTTEKSRGEIWIPLWHNPATYDEIKYVYNEGRSQIGKKYAYTGSDFARAAVSLGVERGISEFVRFGIMERKGQAYLANKLGNVKTGTKQQVNLLIEIDGWLDKVRKEESRSITIRTLLHNMDDAIIKFCIHHRKRDLQEILIILGKIEFAISKSSYLMKKIQPLKKLSPRWLTESNDETPEFRLAMSLASMIDSDEKYPLRCNLEPVKYKNSKLVWNSSSPSAVWTKNNTVQNMIAVLERRCLDAQIRKLETIPLESGISAHLSDILLFLNKQLDYEKISDLLIPFSMIKGDDKDAKRKLDRQEEIPKLMPEIYIAIKSNFPPISFNNDVAKFEPSIISLLKSDKSDLAQKIAHRRLHISGKSTWTYNISKNALIPVHMPKHMIDIITASVLFPVHRSDTKKMIDTIAKRQ